MAVNNGKPSGKQRREELFRAFGAYAGGHRGTRDREMGLKLLRNVEKLAEIRDDDNWTLLHYAAYNDWPEVCRQLVEIYQVDPHEKDSDGWTALHLACSHNHTEIVNYLVNHAHCDPVVMNNDGRTPFDWSKGESRGFLQAIIDKAEKEGLSVVEYAKSVSSHGGNHPGIDHTPYLERATAQGTMTTRLSSIESLADLSAQVSVDSPSISHPDYGLMLDFDPSSLSDGSPTPVLADIRVYADETTIQSCTYPEERKPVSAVYSISLSDTSVPVRTLRIRHCVDPNNPEELEELAFAKTTDDSSRTFEVVLGGIFKPGDHYGEITPKHMCSWTIVEKAKNMFGRPTRYIGTVIYQAVKNRSNINWLMQLIVAKNDPKCIIALREYISNSCGSDVQPDDEFYFTFRESAKGSAPKMGLVPSGTKLSSKNVLKCENGWEIRLDSYEVSQDTADLFKTSTDVPGKCKLKINTRQIVSDTFNDSPVFSLTGIDCDRKDTQISPPISDESNVFETDFKNLKPEIRSSFGPVPTLEAVFGLLKPRSVKWNLIGEQLNVPFNFREELYRYDRRESEAKLEAILNEWIQSECSPVTWDNIMNAMKKMGFRIILNMIKEQLGVAPPDESLHDSDNDDEDQIPTPLSTTTFKEEHDGEEDPRSSQCCCCSCM